MPVRKPGVKLRGNFARAKRKIKDAGIGLVVGAASMTPIKVAAQDRVIDPESTEMTVLVDAIRANMTIENKSSPEKVMKIFKENLGADNEYLIDLDVMMNEEYFLSWAPSLTPPVGSKTSVSEEMEDRIFNSKKSDGMGPYYNLLRNAKVHQKGDKYIYNTDGLYDKYLAIAKRLFPRTNELKTKDIIIHVYCVGPVDQVMMFENISSKDYLTYFGTMILDAATGDVLHHNNEKMDLTNPYRKLPIVAYRLNGEDGRITHVWDANEGVEYVYKTDQADGVIKTFGSSHKSNVKPAVLVHKRVQGNEY